MKPNREYRNEKESQEKNIKKSLISTRSCRTRHNFEVRGSAHVVNTNNRYIKTRIKSKKEVKQEKNSLPVNCLKLLKGAHTKRR